MSEEDRGAVSARALREAFDRSFARPAAPPAEASDDLLALRIQGEAYALPLADVEGLHADRHVLPVATALPALLGLTAFRGRLAPAYDLRVLLGYPGGGAAPRWLVRVRAFAPLALAFDELEAHARIPRATFAAAAAAEYARGEGHRFVRGAVFVADHLRPLIDVAAITEAIAASVGIGYGGV